MEFEGFEESRTYEVFDMVYGTLAYDYLKEFELNKLGIYGTSDLIEYICENQNLNYLAIYEVQDNVSGKIERFETWGGLKNYANIWRERLNEENKQEGEEHRYDVETIEGIEAVFEACNISWHIVSVQTNKN